MNILVIETSTSEYEVGVITDDLQVVLSSNRLQPDYDGIAGLTERCLAKAGVDVSTLDAIAVDQGPGNLTSVRAGLAYANALAYAADLPLYAASSLAIMAQAADQDDDRRAPVFVARAARGKVSGPFFAAVYEEGTATFLRLDHLQKVAESLTGTYDELKLAGTHIEAQAEFLGRTSTIDTQVTKPSVGPLSALLQRGLLPVARQAFPLTDESAVFHA